MKRYHHFSLGMILLTITGILFIGLNSCAKKINFSKSSVVPGADGQVKIKKDKNKNYNINVNVANLAEPKDLTPARSTYVVWMVTGENDTKNMGQLKSSSGLLSKALKASISTVTPFQPKKIFITAENDANITYPQGETVLTTESF